MRAGTPARRGSRSSWPARRTAFTWTCAITASVSGNPPGRAGWGWSACASAPGLSEDPASSSRLKAAARAFTPSFPYPMVSLPRPERASVRVLIVDDHPMVREGLRSMLEPAGVQIVGEAGTGEDALRAASAGEPEVVLLDLELPDLDGRAVRRQLKAQAPDMAVLVITMHDDPSLVRRAVEAGASGYVLKGVGRRELLAALEAVRHGESVVDPSLLRATLSDTRPDPRRRVDAGEPLTSVEQEVLRLVAEGLTNREISRRLRWSVGTVKKYLQRTLDKLGAADRRQAGVEAVKRGFLSGAMRASAWEAPSAGARARRRRARRGSRRRLRRILSAISRRLSGPAARPLPADKLRAFRASRRG